MMMEFLHRLPYSEELLYLIKQCEEWVPRTLTKRAVLFGVTAGLAVYFTTKKRYRLPPGPRGWPLIGNLLEFQNATIYEKLMEWKTQYGPVVTFHAVLLMSDGGKSIAFGDYSPTWKLHRKLATKAIKYYMGGTQLEHTVERALTRGIKLMSQQKGPFNPHKFTTYIMFNIINSICFNYTCDIDDQYFTDMLGIMDAFNTDFGNGILEDYITPLRLFPTNRLQRLIGLVDQYFGYINKDINKHRDTFSKDNIRDFCDAMLLAQEEAGEEEDSAIMSQITDGHISQTVGDIFGAGLDSSRYTLLWALLYLGLNPDIQSKLHQEIDQVLGTRKIPRMSDRSNLPYTEAVLHEVMRLSSIAPLSLPHTTVCDTKIGEYDVPKGTMVIVNLYALHHDPQNWKDPEVFKPERFLDSNGKMAPKPDSWLPFSAGRRVCLGESVAKPELHLLLTGIMRQLEVSLPNREKISIESKGEGILFPSYQMTLKYS